MDLTGHRSRDVFVAKLTDNRRSADKPKEHRSQKKNHRVKIYWPQCGRGTGNVGRGFCGQKDKKTQKKKNLFLHFVFFFFSDHAKNPCAYTSCFRRAEMRDAFGKLVALL